MDIAFNTYSLRKEWKTLTAGGNYEPIVKFIKMLDGVKEVELLDRTFDSDPNTLETIQEVFQSQGISIFSLGPHISPLVGKSYRSKMLKKFKHWIDMAADHGIHNYRVSLGGGSNYDLKKMWIIPIGRKKPENNKQAVEWTLEVLEPAIDYAEERDVSLCIETHHRYSSNPNYQRRLLEALPSENLGFIFDIGNYESRDLSWRSLDVLLEKDAVKYMHAKTYEFDANGFETTLDYPRAIKQMYDAGLEINLSIEWEGKMPTFLGILHTYELCKYSLAKAKGEDYEMQLDFPSNDEIMNSLME